MPRIFSATYTPYTYEELAAPVREATAAHQAVELNFDTLMTDADKMRAFLNEDWQSYKDYKEYVDQLNAAAYDLARNGLTRQNRGNLLQLKRDYNGKIQAINAGILSRQNAIETFNKSAKGQSSRYIGPRPEDYSVDEYMYGNNPFKLGVEGSEIYSYADEQAKASTSRRYQEFTEGGKWRITEVGVDPNTTSMVMDALRNGRNFTDPEYALLALNNPRQFLYMLAVLDDMRSIADDTRQTFGYGQFSEFDDNGNPVWSQNQKKFDAEIYGGLNKGIQYARKSEADPYLEKLFSHNLKMQEKAADFQYDMLKAYISQGLKDGTLRFDENGKIVPGKPATPDYNGFGIISNQFTNEEINEVDNKYLKLKKDDKGRYIPLKTTIKYDGKTLEFKDLIELLKWMRSGNTSLFKDIRQLLNKYDNPVATSALADVGGTSGLSIDDVVDMLENKQKSKGLSTEERSDLLKAKQLKKQSIEFKHRQSAVNNGLFLKDEFSSDVLDKIGETYGFQEGEDFSMKDIINRKDQSTGYVTAARPNWILLSDPSGMYQNDEGKSFIERSNTLKQQQGRAITKLSLNDKVLLYSIDKKDNVSSKKIKKEDAEQIIKSAIASYTTVELFSMNNGKQGGNKVYTPVIVFIDEQGNKVGMSMEELMPASQNASYIASYLIDGKQGVFTDPNIRSGIEVSIGNTLGPIFREEFAKPK